MRTAWSPQVTGKERSGWLSPKSRVVLFLSSSQRVKSGWPPPDEMRGHHGGRPSFGRDSHPTNLHVRGPWEWLIVWNLNIPTSPRH